MSHLRAPATRADRREGGRHGRPGARPAPALPETHIRPQLMRLAVLPPLAVALSAGAPVLFSIRSAGARTSPLLWGVIAAAAGVAAVGILIAAVAADRAARSVTTRVDALRRTAAHGEADLRALVDALRRGETPPQRGRRRPPPADADDFDLLAADLARAHDGAVTAVVRAAQLSSRTGSEQKLEVFVNLARRLQSLVHREISILDDLESDIEDPDLLKGLFHVDHLATRIRRHAENLAVLGGAVSRRQWSNPVGMTEVLRSAIAEVEQYSRVKLVPPVDGELRGHAVADVIHLLAELVENATVFSAPHTQVLLRASLVTSGLAVEVEDRGLGMTLTEQDRMNAVLADPDQVNVASLLADGRIGLYVVSQLARRHGIQVRLQTNIYGGVQAVLVVPQPLLGPALAVPGAVAGTAAEAGTEPAGSTGNGSAYDGRTANGSAYDGRTGNGSVYDGRTGNGSVYDGGNGAGPVGGTVAGGGSGSGAGSAAESGAGAGQGAATGRRRHAQRGTGRHGIESGTYGQHGAAPAPLPVRGPQEARPTPVDAVPGVSAEDWQVVEAHTGVPPTPRVDPVRGTMDKPQLPRRRAQEHIVPQLRGGPAPRQDTDSAVGHDPGLMAAFRRGIGLAEAQQSLDTAIDTAMDTAIGTDREGSTEAGTETEAHAVSAYAESSGYMGADHMDVDPMDADHMDPDHMAPTHTAAPDLGPGHMAPLHMAPAHTAAPHTGRDHTAPLPPPRDHTAPLPMAPDPTPPGHAPLDRPPLPAPLPRTRVHAPAPDDSQGAGRTEGSTPAG
ncbi:sensor histidine kinase [Streptomyces sp. NPDC017095]|uniref:sensor histidine kinase n=1 Tax=Streptomyces sp. NPDC017095 TaxID=3364977 RepID=UPI0037926460